MVLLVILNAIMGMIIILSEWQSSSRDLVDSLFPPNLLDVGCLPSRRVSFLWQKTKRIHWHLKYRITWNCTQILFLSPTPQPENKTKQKAGKNRKCILSWASMLWMQYYQLLTEPQLSGSADFKLPHILLLILMGENPRILSKQEVWLPQAVSKTRMLSFLISKEWKFLGHRC